MKKYLAEALGTGVLVLLGCGSAVLGGYGGAAPLGYAAIAMAFGLAVTAMAYGIGPISGCHINPAVTISVWAAGRMKTDEAAAYIISQIVGGIVGAGVLLLVAEGRASGYDVAVSGLGQNGWGAGYLGEYGMLAAIIVEIVGTFIFTMVILGVTQPSASTAYHPAGLIIGLTLVVIHIVFIPVTGVSVNPARSIGPAIFVGGKALAQVWLFIVMPLIGGLIAGWLHRARILSAE
ncbi:MAG TPA: aquaporin [Bauldia sp.]|nr:aquaporin [Bauldia sp.]